MSKLSISKNGNKNYLAKVIKLTSLEKHPNADRLQITSVDFQNVIVGSDAKVGDIYVFFPLECQINSDFLSATNSYNDKELNKDKDVKGFFESKGRVRAVKLRGEKSMGYVVPIKTVEDFTGVSLSDCVGQEFDTIGDTLFVKKYYVKSNTPSVKIKKDKKPKASRLVDKQVKLHVDTENLRKNIHKINPNDLISVSYKVHGSSFWVSNVLVKRNLNLFEKILKFLKVTIQETEYDILYGSRKVIKNDELQTKSPKGHYYGYDLWGCIADQIKEFIPKGYTLYGECCGYTKEGSYIQKEYDYGCEQGKFRLYIYRITFTNEDGISNELSTLQIQEFCKHFNLETVPLFYVGFAKDLFPEIEINDLWQSNFIRKLEETFNEKDCYICKNKVPEEGIVVRKESMFYFEAYKLKSFRFLQKESELLDKGEVNLEDNQDG